MSMSKEQFTEMSAAMLMPGMVQRLPAGNVLRREAVETLCKEAWSIAETLANVREERQAKDED